MKYLFIISVLMAIKVDGFGQLKIRSADELLSDTSGWTEFLEMAKTAKNKVDIIPSDRLKGKEALYQVQVTTHSYLGAIVYFTGGVFIKGGMIRMLGSGSDKIKRSVPEWNKGKSFNNYGEQPKFVLFADDALGGFFAINGGGLGADVGKIYYLAPEALEWESLDMGHSQFVEFCLNGNLEEFYGALSWDGRDKLIKEISGDQAIFFFPFLWTTEGKDLSKVTKKPISVQEAYSLKTD